LGGTRDGGSRVYGIEAVVMAEVALTAKAGEVDVDRVGLYVGEGGVEVAAGGGAVEDEVIENLRGDGVGAAGGGIGGVGIGEEVELDKVRAGAGRVDVEAGGETLTGGGTGLGGFGVEDGRVGVALGEEHGIHQAFEVGDAAIVAALVEVMDEDDGNAEVEGDAAQLGDGLLEGVEVVFQAGRAKMEEGVEDDEAGIVAEGGMGEEVGFFLAGEVPAGEGGEVQRRNPGDGEAAQKEGNAVVEGVVAEVVLKIEDGGGLDGAAEPGEAEGDVQSEVEEEEGLFGGGVADDEGEFAGTDEVMDDPGLVFGRGGAGIEGVEVEAVVVAGAQRGVVDERAVVQLDAGAEGGIRAGGGGVGEGVVEFARDFGGGGVGEGAIEGGVVFGPEVGGGLLFALFFVEGVRIVQIVEFVQIVQGVEIVGVVNVV
jgi:hypothetical protein